MNWSTVTQKSQWTDEKGLHDETLKDITWNLDGGFTLAKIVAPRRFNYYTEAKPDDTSIVKERVSAGALFAPPRTTLVGATNKDAKTLSASGLLQLTVSVTERGRDRGSTTH